MFQKTSSTQALLKSIMSSLAFKSRTPHHHDRRQWLLLEFVIGIVVARFSILVSLGGRVCVCVCLCVCVRVDDNADQGHSMLMLWKLMSLWKVDGTWGDPLLSSKQSSLQLPVYSLQQTSISHGRTRLHRAQFGELQIWFFRYLIPMKIVMNLAFNLFFGNYVDLLITKTLKFS